MYTHSNELEEVGVISLDGVNVESDPQKELLLGVRNHHFQNSPAQSDYLHYSNAFLSLSLHPQIRMPYLHRILRNYSHGQRSSILRVYFHNISVAFFTQCLWSLDT